MTEEYFKILYLHQRKEYKMNIILMRRKYANHYRFLAWQSFQPDKFIICKHSLRCNFTTCNLPKSRRQTRRFFGDFVKFSAVLISRTYLNYFWMFIHQKTSLRDSLFINLKKYQHLTLSIFFDRFEIFFNQFKVSNFRDHFACILWIDAPRYVSNAGNTTNLSSTWLSC